MKLLRVLMPLAALVLIPAAIACGGDDDLNGRQVTVAVPTMSATQTQAKAQFCTELVGLKTAATQINSLTPASSVEDTKKAQANLKASQAKVKAAAVAVQNVKVDELDAAVTKLDTAIAAVPPGATLSTAAAQIQPQAQAVLQAEANVHTATACPQ